MKIRTLIMAIVFTSFMAVMAFAQTDTEKEALPAAATAAPTSQNILINGEKIDIEAYNIGGSNYFKIRDLAYALKNTDAVFEVEWDDAKNAINLKNHRPYTITGGEMAKGTAGKKTASLSSFKVYLDGDEAQLTSYIIGGR